MSNDQSAPPPLRPRFLSSPKQLFINDEWGDAKSGATFDTLNPTTDKVLGDGGRGIGRGR